MVAGLRAAVDRAALGGDDLDAQVVELEAVVRHGRLPCPLGRVEAAADQVEGVGDVRGEGRDRRGAVAPLQRRDQRPVVMDRAGMAVLLVDAGGGADVGPGLQPEAFDDRDAAPPSPPPGRCGSGRRG